MVHHGGKVGKAGEILSKKTSDKSKKTQAAKILNKHKEEQHKKK